MSEEVLGKQRRFIHGAYKGSLPFALPQQALSTVKSLWSKGGPHGRPLSCSPGFDFRQNSINNYRSSAVTENDALLPGGLPYLRYGFVV